MGRTPDGTFHRIRYASEYREIFAHRDTFTQGSSVSLGVGQFQHRRLPLRRCSLVEAPQGVTVDRLTAGRQQGRWAGNLRTCIPRLDFITKNWSTSFL